MWSLVAITVVAFFVVAELFAIRGALSTTAGESIVARATVASAIGLGTLLIATALVAPWIAAAGDSSQRRLLYWVAASLLVLVCGIGTHGLLVFVDRASSSEESTTELVEMLALATGWKVDSADKATAERRADEALHLAMAKRGSDAQVKADLFRASLVLSILLDEGRISRAEARAEVNLEIDVALASLSPIARYVLREERALWVRTVVPAPGSTANES